jgi:ABC-type nitrate/sulfonate/bicarbonate transport system substrate-binding protein
MKLMNPRSGNVRSRMSFAYPLTFLRRAMAIPALMSIMLALSVSLTWGASSPTKITIHIPGKSLTVMVFYFGKDKGFFFEEGIDAQLVAMSPPVAIAAMVAGELDFSTTLGAATAAIMRGSSLKRVFYVQQDPTFALTAQPEIKTIRELIGKVIGVNAPTDAMGMSAKMILKGNGIDPSQVTFLSTQVTENAYKALLSKRIAATLLPPPYAEEAEARAYSRLAEAKDYAPLSTTGLVASTQALVKNPGTVQAVIRGLLKTMAYLQNPMNRPEMVQYIAGSFKMERSVAEKALASTLTAYSTDGTKPRKAVEREIEIYRETLQVVKAFTPEDLEDMSILKKLH